MSRSTARIRSSAPRRTSIRYESSSVDSPRLRSESSRALTAASARAPPPPGRGLPRSPPAVGGGGGPAPPPPRGGGGGPEALGAPRWGRILGGLDGPPPAPPRRAVFARPAARRRSDRGWRPRRR